LGVVGTNLCNQWGPKQGQWCEPDRRDEDVVEWELASGMDLDTHVILTLAAQNDREVEQVDVKNMYLNAELNKTICMAQPPGFSLPGCENHVWQLLKTLYSLKQAS